MRFYFMRHCQSEANVLHQISNRGEAHPLTPIGLEQAHAITARVRLDGKIKIFASPLLRACQTAAIFAQEWGCEPPVLVDALREFDCGVMEGRSDEDAWQAHGNLFDRWIEHREYDARIEGGESFNDMCARFLPFVDEMLLTYRSAPTNIVCVSHGGLYRCVLPLVIPELTFTFIMEHFLTNSGYVIADATSSGLKMVEYCSQALPS